MPNSHTQDITAAVHDLHEIVESRAPDRVIQFFCSRLIPVHFTAPWFVSVSSSLAWYVASDRTLQFLPRVHDFKVGIRLINVVGISQDHNSCRIANLDVTNDVSTVADWFVISGATVAGATHARALGNASETRCILCKFLVWAVTQVWRWERVSFSGVYVRFVFRVPLLDSAPFSLMLEAITLGIFGLHLPSSLLYLQTRLLHLILDIHTPHGIASHFCAMNTHPYPSRRGSLSTALMESCSLG